MIQSRQDYLAYLEADRLSLNREDTLKNLFFDDIWKFQKLLRRLEYLTNCRKRPLWRAYTHYRYRMQGRRCGFSIPINVFGPGLAIVHLGTIVVSADARIDANCRLHVCVNIGTQAGTSGCAPVIGENCYIGPGAKIFGKIEIGPRTAIGANAVVNRSFPEGGVTLGGIPARVISPKSSDGLLIKGYRPAGTPG